MIYLDASVVIELTDPTSPVGSRIAVALGVIPKERVATSEIVRLECLVVPTRGNDTARIARLETFFGGLVDLPLNRAVYDLAIRLRADRKGLRTPDALHLAAALRHGCTEFWTGDLDLARTPAGLTLRTF